jgi:hypothetical protein
VGSVRYLKYYNHGQGHKYYPKKKINKSQEIKSNYTKTQKIVNKKSQVIGLLATGIIAFTLISLPCFAWDGVERCLNINYVDHVGPGNSRIILNNNPDAVNPTYEELTAFLKKGHSDQLGLNPYSFVCANTLHDNAEKAGYRCAWVDVHFTGGEERACNAFNTVDKGTVFVDCMNGNREGNWDSLVDVNVGKQYIPRDVFHGSVRYDSMGTVENSDLYW